MATQGGNARCGGSRYGWVTSLTGGGVREYTSVCAMPLVSLACLNEPASCANSIPPVQLAPTSLVGAVDTRLWASEGDCSATVKVVSGYDPTRVGNILPSPSYAATLEQAYPLLSGETASLS